MKLPDRSFDSSIAVRSAVPLWFGISGPSGGGKTWSALEIATGMQAVRGGEIAYIDTEANRALHYADYFKFHHIPFVAPFGSLDYLAAIKFAEKKAAGGVIVIDSMSHEHEGEGGMLETHEAELDRMAGTDYQKREAMKMLAWGKPKNARRRLINSMLQMNTSFVLCFRAKDSSKPVKKEGEKTKVVHMGFMPIAGTEFVFELTASALLLPGAKGVPTWTPDEVGEKMMVKLPEQFKKLFADGKPLSRDHGRFLAEWARGGATTRQVEREDKKAVQGVYDRVEAYKAALKKASTPIDVEAVWRKAGPLRQEVPPDLLDEITLAYEGRLTEVQ
jgi:hypothetical protein